MANGMRYKPTIIIIGLVILICIYAGTRKKSIDFIRDKIGAKHIVSDSKDKHIFCLYGNNIALDSKLITDSEDLDFYDHKYFVLGYNYNNYVPSWVAWILTKDNVRIKIVGRYNKFMEDTSLKRGMATLKDYSHSGYDRGHMCPSGDMTWDKLANQETFLLSNICPQDHSLNSGMWNRLESWVRDMAIANDSILVITGPIFDNKTQTIGWNRVVVPTAFFKIIVDISYPDYKAIAFIMPNNKLTGDIFAYQCTIKDIEKRTGLNFFAQYDNHADIQQLEIMQDSNKW